MKILFPLFVLLCFSCGGSLSSEQRKKIRANMEAKSIKKISDAELTEAALSYSHNILRVIENARRSDQQFIDSLNRVYEVDIIFMKPGDTNLRNIERQIIDAYASTNGSTDPGDNLQKMGNDSLLYTKPILKTRSDGTFEFIQALALRIPKKKVILSIKN